MIGDARNEHAFSFVQSFKFRPIHASCCSTGSVISNRSHYSCTCRLSDIMDVFSTSVRLQRLGKVEGSFNLRPRKKSCEMLAASVLKTTQDSLMVEAAQLDDLQQVITLSEAAEAVNLCSIRCVHGG